MSRSCRSALASSSPTISTAVPRRAHFVVMASNVATVEASQTCEPLGFTLSEMRDAMRDLEVLLDPPGAAAPDTDESAARERLGAVLSEACASTRPAERPRSTQPEPSHEGSGCADVLRHHLAVAEGFEPSVGFHPQTLSRRSP